MTPGPHRREAPHAVPATDDAEAIDTALASLTEDAPAELALRVRRADGAHRWFALHPRLVRDGRTGTVQMHTSLRDVTDQLLAEEELARFRGPADRAADLVAISVADGTGLYVSPAGRDMLRLSRTRQVAEVTVEGCDAPADASTGCSPRWRAPAPGPGRCGSSTPPASSSRSGRGPADGHTVRSTAITRPVIGPPHLTAVRTTAACGARRSRPPAARSHPAAARPVHRPRSRSLVG